MWKKILEFLGLVALFFIISLFPEFFTKNDYRGKGEVLACRALSEITGGEVKCNIRPDFLKNPETGKNLELDCFSPQSRNAVEYDGVQHYQFPNPFHKTKKEFQKQQNRDKTKDRLCLEKKINLIRVPYTVDSSLRGEKRYRAIRNYIWERVKWC